MTNIAMNETSADIIAAFRGVSFSKTQAAKLVGGRTRLESLVAQGKIIARKTSSRQNGKWFCDGIDVIMHIKRQI